MRRFLLPLLLLLALFFVGCGYNNSVASDSAKTVTYTNKPQTQQTASLIPTVQASPSASGVQPATQDKSFAFAPYLYIKPSSTTDSSSNQIVQAAQQIGTKDYLLGFVVSKGCQAIWDDFTNVGWSASGAVDPWMAEVNQVRQLGGDVAISFGGANGTELAQACTNVTDLQRQYQSVIDAYKVTRLDFVIDGAAVMDTVSVDRRNKAIAALEQANPNLVISYSLPVLPTGLTDDNVKLLQNVVANGVKVSIVNIMAMDYGGPDDHMGLDVISAAQATEKQLATIGLSAQIGITPMIGRNDVPGETFSLDDARNLVTFARQNSYIGRLSMWSLERDKSCPAGSTVVASPTCSGIAQQQYDFMKVFSQI